MSQTARIAWVALFATGCSSYLADLFGTVEEDGADHGSIVLNDAFTGAIEQFHSECMLPGPLDWGGLAVSFSPFRTCPGVIDNGPMAMREYYRDAVRDRGGVLEDVNDDGVADLATVTTSDLMFGFTRESDNLVVFVPPVPTCPFLPCMLTGSDLNDIGLDFRFETPPLILTDVRASYSTKRLVDDDPGSEVAGIQIDVTIAPDSPLFRITLQDAAATCWVGFPEPVASACVTATLADVLGGLTPPDDTASFDILLAGRPRITAFLPVGAPYRSGRIIVGAPIIAVDGVSLKTSLGRPTEAFVRQVESLLAELVFEGGLPALNTRIDDNLGTLAAVWLASHPGMLEGVLNDLVPDDKDVCGVTTIDERNLRIEFAREARLCGAAEGSIDF